MDTPETPSEQGQAEEDNLLDTMSPMELVRFYRETIKAELAARVLESDRETMLHTMAMSAACANTLLQRMGSEARVMIPGNGPQIVRPDGPPPLSGGQLG